MAGRFEGQVVWITGGGSGIGRALALAFADEGADVAVSGRRRGKIDEVAAAVTERGRRGLAVCCDVTDDATLGAAVDRIVAELGRLDVAVANAGFSVSGQVLRQDVEDWRRQFETNTIGAVMTARYALPELVKRGGRVAFVASVASMFTYPNGGPYCASKAAVHLLTKSLACEWGGAGITVNAIGPTVFPSGLPAWMYEDDARARSVREGNLARIPLGRLGEPEDLAGAVLFLASAASAFVTGQVMYVDGGYTAS